MRGFIELEAYLGGEFIHPGARATTEALLQMLGLRPGGSALELGCGTGATAVLVTRTLGARVTMLDRSLAMLVAAHNRLRKEQLLGEVDLMRADAGQPWPFREVVFDAVYAESAIALLEVESVIGECVRVIRPRGHLALTERIWRPGVSQALADEVNAISHRAFGIPAATRYPLDRSAWLHLLHQSGLVNERAIPVDTLLAAAHPGRRLRARVCRAGRYLARPQTIWQSVWFKAMARRHQRLWSHLECYVFLAQKPES